MVTVEQALPYFFRYYSYTTNVLQIVKGVLQVFLNWAEREGKCFELPSLSQRFLSLKPRKKLVLGWIARACADRTPLD
jgi:hypothetical protein